jgi:transposase
LSTKIHALVDALGNPLHFLLTPEQAHDRDGADALLPLMPADRLIADKAGAGPRARHRRDPGGCRQAGARAPGRRRQSRRDPADGTPPRTARF